MPPPRLRNRGDMALTVKIDRFGFKGREARSISHWSPYDPNGVVNADP